MLRKDFDNNSYLVNNNALYRKHTEHISTTEPLYLDGMPGSDNIVHEPEDPMIVRYVTTEDNLTVYLWGTSTGIKSALIDGLYEVTEITGGQSFTFAEAGEHVVEIKFSTNTIPGGFSMGNSAPIVSVVIPSGIETISGGAFSGNYTLKEVVIPYTVTTVENQAFGGCFNLESVILPDSPIEFIGVPFSGCINLKKISIPKGVTGLNGGTFGGCNLEEVYIDTDEIPGGIFYGKSSLKAVTIGNNTKIINNGSFVGSANLTSITIGKGVTDIYGGAFGGCSSLEEINYGSTIDDVKKIRLYAGWNDATKADVIHCVDGDYTIPFAAKIIAADGSKIWGYGPTVSSSLTDNLTLDPEKYVKIEIGELCKTINSFAFSNRYSFTNVREIILSNTVTTIGIGAFNSCGHLDLLIIPESVTSLATGSSSTFRDVDTLIINSSQVANTKISAWCGLIDSIKHIKLGKSVTRIGYQFAHSLSNLLDVYIPDSVTEIGSYAFYSCSKLLSIHIPDSVTRIEEYTFNSCSRLKEVKIPESTTYIGQGAFSGCSSLESIHIPDSVTILGSYAFSACTKLKEVNIPKNLSNSSGGSVFDSLNVNTVYYNAGSQYSSTLVNLMSGGQGIKKIIFGDNVTSIKNGECNGLYALETVVMTDNITSIGLDAFNGCTNLKNVTVSKNITSIGRNAFYGCKLLQDINIPEGVTIIEQATFYGCKSLKSINIPKSVTTIASDAFSGCSSLTNVELPNSVINIGDLAFYNCDSLLNVTIPNSITEIPLNLFNRCSNLLNVTLPETITKIGGGAFSYCKNNLQVKILNPVPPLLTAGLFTNSTGYKIYVPAESVNTYKSAYIWSDYASSIYPIPEE